jgi:hypothetical protein
VRPGAGLLFIRDRQEAWVNFNGSIVFSEISGDAVGKWLKTASFVHYSMLANARIFRFRDGSGETALAKIPSSPRILVNLSALVSVIRVEGRYQVFSHFPK